MPDKGAKYRDQEALDNFEVNKEYENGPVFKRKCTDWWCCPVFVAFVVVMVVISIYGFTNGDPANLATPFDSEGNQCGLDKGYSDFPYLYFTNPINYGVDIISFNIYKGLDRHLVQDCIMVMMMTKILMIT